jgi:von Willebrand factor type A domain-containing protein
LLGKFTDIIILLDTSASMHKVAAATREAYNSFILKQKDVSGEARLTLATFSDPHSLHFVSRNIPIRSATSLTKETYDPYGSSTALYDAIAQLIDTVGSDYAQTTEHNRPEKVVFVIQTDGEENASRTYKAYDVKERIQRQRNDYKWEFIFLGANQDAILSAKEIAIPYVNAMTYSANSAATANTLDSVSEQIGNYRSRANYAIAFSDEDRKAATIDDADASWQKPRKKNLTKS